MQRITDANLQAVVDRINSETNSPMTSYTRTPCDGPNGKTFTTDANIGNYHLSWAYGGVSLHRMVNPGGGVTDIFRSGHMPKRELYERMHAFLCGLDATRAA